MQIKDLPSSSTLNSTDVLAKDTSGGTTQKITGSNLASQIKSLGNLLGTSDVVNNLTSTATNKPLSAAQGKELKTSIDTINSHISYFQIINLGTISNESKVLTFTNTVDFILITNGGSEFRFSMWLCKGRSSTSYAKEIGASNSVVSVTAGTNTITITASAVSVTLYMLVYNGNYNV